MTPAGLAALLDAGTARCALVAAFRTPVVTGAAHVLSRAHRRSVRPLRSELDDVCQEVFIELFAADGRVLRRWDPTLGRDLGGFVRLVAERTARQWVRSRARRFALEQASAFVGDGVDPAPTPESVVAAGELLQKLLEQLHRELTPKGWGVFRELFIEEREVFAVGEKLSMQPTALWAWRSRLTSRSRETAMRLAAG